MAEMNKLAERVRDLEEQLVICIRCGMCQAVCPLFEQSRRESDVARGKLALLDGLMNSMFSDSQGVSERLNKCLLCGSCAANCPSGVNVVEIFIRARAILSDYQALSPLKKKLFKKILAHPETFDRITDWVGSFQRMFAKNDKNAQGTSCARFVSPLLGDRHFVPMAKDPFHKSLSQLSDSKGVSGLRVVMFTGCLIDKIFPKVAVASLEVLNHHGVGVIVPEGQGCCGIPALAAGDIKTFEKLVEHNMALLLNEKFDYLVTACATCTSTIKKLWPAIYRSGGSEFKRSVKIVSEKTLDINQFVVNNTNFVFSGGTEDEHKELVTYHDPCHLKKSLGVFNEPRQIIKASGKTLKEMTGSDKCCGMGGSFNIYHYDLSSDIGALKQKKIVETGCSSVATGFPACMLHITDMLDKAGTAIKVCHPIELYADAICEMKRNLVNVSSTE